MSTQRGNAIRSRPQKHQNTTAYKKDRYGQTPLTKALDSLRVEGLCDRCTSQIQWRIKFKKYKKLTAPSKCVGCMQRAVKEAYHTMCRPCATKAGKCPKCCIVHHSVPTTNPSSVDGMSEPTEKLSKISLKDDLEDDDFSGDDTSESDPDESNTEEVEQSTTRNQIGKVGKVKHSDSSDTESLSDCSTGDDSE